MDLAIELQAIDDSEINLRLMAPAAKHGDLRAAKREASRTKK